MQETRRPSNSQIPTGLSAETELRFLNGGDGIRTGEGVRVVLTGVESTTPLAALNNGTGIGTVNGADFSVLLTDGTTSFDVNISFATTLEDLFDAIEDAAVQAGVTGFAVSLDTDGTAILLADAQNNVGNLMVTALNGSTAAADLGIEGTGAGDELQGTPISDGASDIRITQTRSPLPLRAGRFSAAEELGVTVSNTPAYGAPYVSEHALALALAVSRQIVQNDRHIRQGGWTRGFIDELYHKTLGVVGTGAIGRRMIQLGQGIGMKVIAWTVNPTPARALRIGGQNIDVPGSRGEILQLLQGTEHCRQVVRDRLRIVGDGIAGQAGNGALALVDDEDLALFGFLRLPLAADLPRVLAVSGHLAPEMARHALAGKIHQIGQSHRIGCGRTADRRLQVDHRSLPDQKS